MDIVSKINGNTLSATEFNQMPTELETLITSSGQTVSDAILNQDTIAVSRYAANNFYIDSGAADAYVLTLAASMTNPVSATVPYFIGMTIRFRAGNAGTGGAATVNVNGAGVKSLKEADGSTNPLSIPTTEDTEWRYDGTVFRKVNLVAPASTTLAGIVELLTNAELAAGTDATRAATAVALLSLLTLADVTITNGSFSTATNISSAFGKWILKFGSTSTALNTGVAATITFTNAFPTGCVVALAIPNFSGSASGFQINLVSKAAGNAVFRVDSSSYAGGFSWIAIGY